MSSTEYIPPTWYEDSVGLCQLAPPNRMLTIAESRHRTLCVECGVYPSRAYKFRSWCTYSGSHRQFRIYVDDDRYVQLPESMAEGILEFLVRTDP